MTISVTQSTIRRVPPEPARLACSPDGESRGKTARVGDLFPLDGAGHVMVAHPAVPSRVRPWGLRFARPASPQARKHEGPTKDTSGTPDGNKPGEELSGV